MKAGGNSRAGEAADAWEERESGLLADACQDAHL